MFKYIPNTDKDVAKMLEYIGVSSVEELFEDIPGNVKLGRRLELNEPKSELEVEKRMKSLAGKNKSTEDLVCFLGAGTYDHYIPSIIKHVVSRSEFSTAYTPYQPEISQGTLQAIFEFQTMIANLTGLDVSNASMYDGPTATAEAAMMALDNQKGNKVIISSTVHPEIRDIVKTYMRFRGAEVIEINEKDGVTDLEHLASVTDKEAVGIILQSPNFFGNIEKLDGVKEIAKANKALFILNADPMSFGVLKSPGDYGVDIAVGDAQSFGNAMNYGGPHVGYMATTKKLMRKMPGRIAGETVDLDGKRAYVLTLQAREQHIRREKASSNICSNQALCALTATVYLSTMGKRGLVEVAEQCVQKSHYLYNKLIETGKFRPVSNGSFFKEFVLECDMDIDALNEKLLDKGFLGGYNLGATYPEKKNQVLLCVTEKRSKEEMDCFIQTLKEVM